MSDEKIRAMQEEIDRLRGLVEARHPAAAGVRATRLTAQHYGRMLAEFCEAHGAEQIEASYGWEGGGPRGMVRNERAWSFATGAARVGWGSVMLNTSDDSDDEAVLTVGVFPEHQRRGYRTLILDWLCVEAARLGADYASMIVRKVNEAHYNRTMREAHSDGSAWIYAGDVWEPAPGYGYFVRHLSGMAPPRPPKATKAAAK